MKIYKFILEFETIGASIVVVVAATDDELDDEETDDDPFTSAIL